MAFTGVRLRQPWEAEVERIAHSLRIDYSDKSNLLYLIHPGNAGDCDFNGVAKEGISQELENIVRQNQRAILIYPMDGGVYIDTTKVTDIRGGCEEEKWIEDGDLRDITQATFVGGKLTKCLGHSYGTFVQTARKTGVQEIRVRLPLNSIYTEDGYNAAQEFLAGVSSIGEVESLCALLTPINDGTFSYYDKSLTEYGFLGVIQPWITKLHLNGQHVGTFGKEQDSTPIPEGWERSPHYQDQKPLEINLLVECNTIEGFGHEGLAIKANHRWEKIREAFAPYIQGKR